MPGAETMAWSRHQQVARGYLGNAPPPRIRVLLIVKKIRRSKHATNPHKHGRGSYLSDGTLGDSQSPVEAEPLRSKDRGFFSYNIEKKKMPCSWSGNRTRDQRHAKRTC